MVPLVGKQDDNTQFRASVLDWPNRSSLLTQDNLQEAALEAATDLQTELTNNITEINAMNKALPIKPEVFHMRPDIHQDLEEILVDRRANRVRTLVISWLQAILDCQAVRDLVLKLTGDQAEAYLEALQQVLDWCRDTEGVRGLFPASSVGDVQTLRRRMIRLLIPLAKRRRDLSA